MRNAHATSRTDGWWLGSAVFVIAVGVAAGGYYLEKPDPLENGSNHGERLGRLQSAATRAPSASRPGFTAEVARSEALAESAGPTTAEVPAASGVAPTTETLTEGPHHSETSVYLGSFLSSDPDIAGWNGHLNELAAIAELDSGSVRDDESRNRIEGHFVVPGSGTKIAFTITDEGYSLDSKDTVVLSALERTPFSYHASLAFQEEEGTIRESHGIVQFMPQDGQRFFEEGPVGYIYGMTEQETAYRPMRGEIREGDYCVVVPPKGSNHVTQIGDLGAAYHWMSRLQDVERSVALQRVSRRPR